MVQSRTRGVKKNGNSTRGEKYRQLNCCEVRLESSGFPARAMGDVGRASYATVCRENSNQGLTRLKLVRLCSNISQVGIIHTPRDSFTQEKSIKKNKKK